MKRLRARALWDGAYLVGYIETRKLTSKRARARRQRAKMKVQIKPLRGKQRSPPRMSPGTFGHLVYIGCHCVRVALTGQRGM